MVDNRNKLLTKKSINYSFNETIFDRYETTDYSAKYLNIKRKKSDIEDNINYKCLDNSTVDSSSKKCTIKQFDRQTNITQNTNNSFRRKLVYKISRLKKIKLRNINLVKNINCFSMEAEDDSVNTENFTNFSNEDVEIKNNRVPVQTHIYRYKSRPLTLKKLLPSPTVAESKKKCIIIDLDETLVHSYFKEVKTFDLKFTLDMDNKGQEIYVCKRPYAELFLEKMKDMFECVLFTASLPKYANPVVNFIDKTKAFKHRLYRDSCVFHRGGYVKDLSMIGRPLKNILILDNSPLAFMFNMANAIQIKSWFNDTEDRALLDLIPYLERLSRAPTVPEFLVEELPPSSATHPAGTSLIREKQQSGSSPVTQMIPGPIIRFQNRPSPYFGNNFSSPSNIMFPKKSSDSSTSTNGTMIDNISYIKQSSSSSSEVSRTSLQTKNRKLAARSDDSPIIKNSRSLLTKHLTQVVNTSQDNRLGRVNSTPNYKKLTQNSPSINVTTANTVLPKPNFLRQRLHSAMADSPRLLSPNKSSSNKHELKTNDALKYNLHRPHIPVKRSRNFSLGS